MYSEEIINKLDKELNEIRENFSQSTGGKSTQSICFIRKYGTPSDYSKYNEGKEFIIRRVLNLMKKDLSQDEIKSFLSDNERKFKAFNTSESTASSAWQSYADGGFDGIALIRKTLNMF